MNAPLHRSRCKCGHVYGDHGPLGPFDSACLHEECECESFRRSLPYRVTVNDRAGEFRSSSHPSFVVALAVARTLANELKRTWGDVRRKLHQADPPKVADYE